MNLNSDLVTSRRLEETKPFRTFHGLALDFVVTEHQNFPFEVQHWPLLTPFEQYQVLGPIVKHSPRRVKYKDVLFAISQLSARDCS